MADIPVPENKQHVREAALEALGATQRAIGATPSVPVRVLVLMAVTGICLAFAPLPYSGVGIASLVLLALDVGRARRA